jgi:hypothetical protein
MAAGGLYHIFVTQRACILLAKPDLKLPAKWSLRRIYIVLQPFYTLSGCVDNKTDRFVNYEKI